MKAVITDSGHFSREVEVAPISALPGAFHLRFSSQLRSARDPDAWQRNFDLTLQRSELIRLKELLEAAL